MRRRLRAALVTAACAASAITVPAVTASAAPARPSGGAGQPTGAYPSLSLVTAQRAITVPWSAQGTAIDPGIWVASLGQPLRLDVSRAGYRSPITITQELTGPSGQTALRRLPPGVLDGWNGLRGFTRIIVRDRAGKVRYDGDVTLCPDSYTPARVGPDSPLTSRFPQYCDSSDPFVLGNVWGIARDWAVDPTQENGPTVALPVGTYRVTESVTTQYRRLFRIPARSASATITMTVAKQAAAARRVPMPPGRSATRPAPAGTAGAAQAVPVLPKPPRTALPDLVPLPSWGISVDRASGRDLLMFGATVWVGGNGPLDVEGFRQNGSPVMPAWQYFYVKGKAIGRVRAGTMGFDAQHGHEHWHFEQFAAYRLLTVKSSLAVRSQKVGFCIAPTDEVDLTQPDAVAQVASLGFSGNCGSPTALWVQEFMPVGWGDTYFQSVAGQAFDITDLPDGKYYIEVAANPEHVLRELDTGNDVSLREVILSGKKGHRTVRVPAFDGIDSE